jgi:hypothetical protein
MAQDEAGAVKRGRPKRFDGTPVSVRLPATLHDRLSQDAVKRGVDLSRVIRERLAQNGTQSTLQSRSGL